MHEVVVRAIFRATDLGTRDLTVKSVGCEARPSAREWGYAGDRNAPGIGTNQSRKGL